MLLEKIKIIKNRNKNKKVRTNKPQNGHLSTKYLDV